MKEQYRKLIVLYCTMFKIGCFTFGGGWSIIAQIEEEFCKCNLTEYMTKRTF